MRMMSRSEEYTIKRAIEMLNVAAEYIEEHWPDGIIEYDEAACDGYCVSEDCKVAAEELGSLLVGLGED